MKIRIIMMNKKIFFWPLKNSKRSAKLQMMPLKSHNFGLSTLRFDFLNIAIRIVMSIITDRVHI